MYRVLVEVRCRARQKEFAMFHSRCRSAQALPDARARVVDTVYVEATQAWRYEVDETLGR